MTLAYSFWFVTWAIAYGTHFGLGVFAWACCIGNALLLIALWTRSRWVLSLAALLVLGPQAAWCLDVLLRLVGVASPLAAATTLFDSSAPAFIRALTLFHAWVPVVLVWRCWRSGYDANAFKAALLAAPALVLIGSLVGSNINRADLGVPFAAVGYLLVFVLPTHVFLKRVARA